VRYIACRAEMGYRARYPAQTHCTPQAGAFFFCRPLLACRCGDLQFGRLRKCTGQAIKIAKALSRQPGTGKSPRGTSNSEPTSIIDSFLQAPRRPEHGNTPQHAQTPRHHIRQPHDVRCRQPVQPPRGLSPRFVALSPPVCQTATTTVAPSLPGAVRLSPHCTSVI
jgi:hypothetical protein